MKWQQDEGPVITAGVVNKTVPYKSVTSSLTVLVTRNVTGSKFSCTTYFSENNKPSNIDNTEAPEYNYTCHYRENLNMDGHEYIGGSIHNFKTNLKPSGCSIV